MRNLAKAGVILAIGTALVINNHDQAIYDDSSWYSSEEVTRSRFDDENDRTLASNSPEDSTSLAGDWTSLAEADDSTPLTQDTETVEAEEPAEEIVTLKNTEEIFKLYEATFPLPSTGDKKKKSSIVTANPYRSIGDLDINGSLKYNNDQCEDGDGDPPMKISCFALIDVQIGDTTIHIDEVLLSGGMNAYYYDYAEDSTKTRHRVEVRSKKGVRTITFIDGPFNRYELTFCIDPYECQQEDEEVAQRQADLKAQAENIPSDLETLDIADQIRQSEVEQDEPEEFEQEEEEEFFDDENFEEEEQFPVEESEESQASFEAREDLMERTDEEGDFEELLDEKMLRKEEAEEEEVQDGYVSKITSPTQEMLENPVAYNSEQIKEDSKHRFSF
ncbi:MAG: hypothetical protein HOE90_16870 [Bacteriovoracaceae bacterium]|jgi:hypothetical protein|nr:hypothetical protein [Bacteriovoracaceae bacterium]